MKNNLSKLIGITYLRSTSEASGVMKTIDTGGETFEVQVRWGDDERVDIIGTNRLPTPDEVDSIRSMIFDPDEHLDVFTEGNTLTMICPNRSD